MISDLPTEFPLSRLSKIDLGMAEARDDDLLLQCVTPLPIFQEITSGKKDIIHGYRGTGKSSVVRLIAEGVLKFEGEPGFENIVLVIDEELEYRSIRDYLNRQAEKGTNPSLLLRIVWDLLICYRAMKFVQEHLNNSDPTLRHNIQHIETLFGVSKPKVGLIELILSQKRKVGVKLDSNLPSIVDMYVGVEPNTPSAEKDEMSILMLVDYVRYLVRLLNDKKLTLHVLLDRLDDFVVQEEYDTQRVLLQQLLACQADYRTKYGRGRLRLVTFLRTDLFARIDLQPLGPDKVAQRSLEIRWSQSDIRRFIAKRLALNLLKILDKNSLGIQIDQDRYWVSKEEISKLEETKTTLANFNVMDKGHWERFFWLLRIFKRRAENGTRISSFDDAKNEVIITSLLPRMVKHKTLAGETKEIGLFSYLDTHFQLGFGQATPRAVLLFLSDVILIARDYYSANSDILVKLNSAGEYELLRRSFLLQAYSNFQRTMWDIQLQISGSLRPMMMMLSTFRTKTGFSFKDFITIAKISEDEAKQFLGFCTHTGVLECANATARVTDREYKIPFVFQTPLESAVGS